MRTRVTCFVMSCIMFRVVSGVRSGVVMRGASVGGIVHGVYRAPVVGAGGVVSMMEAAREGDRSDERAGRRCSS